jgi:heme-degrading monooxygenase HmoA
MFAVIGRVQIKPGNEEVTRQMLNERGVHMFEGAPGFERAYWARPVDAADTLIQHSYWLFDTEEGARAAEKTFNSVREMPDAPVVFVSCDVCEVIGEA